MVEHDGFETLRDAGGILGGRLKDEVAQGLDPARRCAMRLDV